MRLIERPPWNRQPSQDAVEEFEAAILADSRVRPAVWTSPVARAGFLAASALFKYGGIRGLNSAPVLPRTRLVRLKRQYFAVLMGPQFAKCMPHFMLPAAKAIYLFDVWPDVRERVIAFIDKFTVDHVFISASQSADYVRDRVSASVHWVPEGLDPRSYRHRPMSDRDIDVLQLGRKYDTYHEQIVDALTRHGKSYLYEKRKGEIVFPTRDGFIEGLARSRVSVCVPSSVTHPDRSGDVETMTLRYLQSMASKCLVVGRAPEEMIRLFGYNPVVEIDASDPVRQLLDILENMDRFSDLIDRNHREVLARHTWHQRWRDIAEVLFDRELPRAIRPDHSSAEAAE